MSGVSRGNLGKPCQVSELLSPMGFRRADNVFLRLSQVSVALLDVRSSTETSEHNDASKKTTGETATAAAAGVSNRNLEIFIAHKFCLTARRSWDPRANVKVRFCR